MVGDKGLVVKDKAAHHAISAKFAKPIDASNKPLVVQYEVKLQGAYSLQFGVNQTIPLTLAQTASSVVVLT